MQFCASLVCKASPKCSEQLSLFFFKLLTVQIEEEESAG